MSNYRGNAERCPHCGITYGKFRTGMTYQQVYDLLKDNESDPEKWKYKRRHTILGNWFAMKQQLWAQHTEEGGCEKDPRNIAARALAHDVDMVEALDEATFGGDDSDIPF